MKLFVKSHDGGKNSGVTGYWLIEWKSVFSICLLKFEPNHRENYHSHAFNALTWWLHGKAKEEFPNREAIIWTPSIIPKYTPKSNIHRYQVERPAWAFTVRGPWDKTWEEYSPKAKKFIKFGFGRKILGTRD